MRYVERVLPLVSYRRGSIDTTVMRLVSAVGNEYFKLDFIYRLPFIISLTLQIGIITQSLHVEKGIIHPGK